MNKNKTVGRDWIVIEMMPTLDDLGTDKINEILNEIYGSLNLLRSSGV